MTVWVVYGHDGNGAWVVGVYKSYAEALKVQAAERTISTFRNDFIAIASKELE